MISYIKGELVSLTNETLIVENNNMGFIVNIPSVASFPGAQIGEKIKVYTYMNVREDDISLFGFGSKDELELFKMLITVSSVGPKSALAILSVLSVDDLRVAIISGDSKAIAKAPGVGPKSAQRVIIDLKDKIDFESALLGNDETAIVGKVSKADSSVRAEVVAALVSLGASESEAFKAANAVEGAENMSVDEYLGAALKIVSF